MSASAQDEAEPGRNSDRRKGRDVAEDRGAPSTKKLTDTRYAALRVSPANLRRISTGLLRECAGVVTTPAIDVLQRTTDLVYRLHEIELNGARIRA